MHLILNRRGVCKVKSSSKNQCKAVGHEFYEYSLKLTCLPKLDKDGFIIDHTTVHKAVECVFNKGATSCEQLIMAMADSVEQTCKNHKAKAVKVYIKLWPKMAGKEEVMAFMELEKMF